MFLIRITNEPSDDVPDTDDPDFDNLATSETSGNSDSETIKLEKNDTNELQEDKQNIPNESLDNVPDTQASSESQSENGESNSEAANPTSKETPSDSQIEKKSTDETKENKDKEKNTPLKVLGTAISMSLTFCSAVNPENVNATTQEKAELLGRYEMSENEKRKSIETYQVDQQESGDLPPDLVDSLNEQMNKLGISVTFPDTSVSECSKISRDMEENASDKEAFSNPAIEQVVRDAYFKTTPFREFEADHGIVNEEDSEVTTEMKNIISEIAENYGEKLASTAPLSTEYLNEQKMKFIESASTIIDSGNNFKIREVHQGDVFVRICADSDRGISPFFTTPGEIANCSFESDDRVLHINETQFREQFSLPKDSRLEQCQIFKAKEDFKAFVSEIAPSTELWGIFKHSGGAGQTIILDREKLSHVNSVAVITHSEEEFSRIEAENNHPKG